MVQVRKGYHIGSSWYPKQDFGQKNPSNSGRTGVSVKKAGKLTVRRSISASAYMMRIAQAKTPSQVNAVIRMAQADLQFVKTCNTDSYEIEKAKKIINHVIAKSRVKISRLKKEQNMEQQQRVAEDKEKREITENLKKKRRARNAEEAAGIADMRHATVARVQKDKETHELSARERAALNGDTAALMSLSVAVVSEAAEVVGTMAGVSGQTCGTSVDVGV